MTPDVGGDADAHGPRAKRRPTPSDGMTRAPAEGAVKSEVAESHSARRDFVRSVGRFLHLVREDAGATGSSSPGTGKASGSIAPGPLTSTGMTRRWVVRRNGNR